MTSNETRRCCKTPRGSAAPHADKCRHNTTIPSYVNFDVYHDASGYAANARKKVEERRGNNLYRLAKLAQRGGAGFFDLFVGAAVRMGMVKAKIAQGKKR